MARQEKTHDPLRYFASAPEVIGFVVIWCLNPIAPFARESGRNGAARVRSRRKVLYML